MFVDVKRSTQYLKEQQDLYMFSEQLVSGSDGKGKKMDLESI
jgi:hypothetical protein